MPAHDNGYAILQAAREGNAAYGRFLYLAPVLSDLPPGYITTIAGVGSYAGEYGPAQEASLRQAWGMTFDASGILYYVDTPNNRVMRIRSDGIAEPFAGNALSNGPHPSVPTPALDVTMSFPRATAFDSQGNLIVPDGDYYLWRVDRSGTAELIAGTGHEAHSVSENVPAKATAIGYPSYVAVDADDNVYFIDWTNARVRRIDRNGMLTTVAGNGTYGYSGDGGPATAAQFDLPFNDLGGLTFDGRGNLLLVDWRNHRIRKISLSTGTIDTIVGPSISGHTLDNLLGLAATPDGSLYFANAAEIYKRAPDGTLTKIASGKRGFSEDGATLPGAAIGLAKALAVDPAGNLVFADSDTYRIRRIDKSTNALSTIAGTGPRFFGEGGPATAGAFQTANMDLAFTASGDLLVSDNDRIWIIGSDGVQTRFAGAGYNGLFDVPPLNAQIAPSSVSANSDGTIDFTEGSLGVFRIDAAGIVRHVAGKIAVCEYSGDGGTAINAGFCQVWDALRDQDGNVFVADANNNRIRKIDTAGTISTFAGSGPVNGLERYGSGSTCGDGGAAASACINTPYGLAFDDGGNLYVCENAGRIRKIDRAGIISTFAIVPCTKLAWAYGSLFAVGGDSVARISRFGIVTRMTATGIGFSGDGGPAIAAHVFEQKQSHGVAIDREGNLVFVDGDNLRIRAIRYGAVLAPAGAAIVATATGFTIRAVVNDAGGHPAEGVRVDFTAPASGASCTLGAPFIITDANGTAAVSCTPNCIGGTYNVVARPMNASSTAAVSFTNAFAPCHHRAVRH